MNQEVKRYAPVTWTAYDVQTLRPYWSLERCERELAENEKHVQDRLIELGWDVLDTLIGSRIAYVIVSASEDGCWSNEDGWGAFASATIFDNEEKDTFALPQSAGGDALWYLLSEAEAKFGLHPSNPEYDGDAAPDPSDRRDESTATLLCQKLLDGGFVALSDTAGPTLLLERNTGALAIMAADDGEYHGEFLTAEVAFAYADRQHMIQRVTMEQVLAVQPLGETGFLLPDGNELWVHPRAIMAKFVPQAIVNGGKDIIDIDGARNIDVTDKVLGMRITELTFLDDDQQESDWLVNPAEFGHSGPFRVEIVEAVKTFFGVEDLSEIDDDVFEEARAVRGIDGEYKLQIVYSPAQMEQIEAIDAEVMQAVGQEIAGAGTFLGAAPQRDMEFYFDSRVAAEAAAAKVRQLEAERKLGLEVSVTVA